MYTLPVERDKRWVEERFVLTSWAEISGIYYNTGKRKER